MNELATTIVLLAAAVAAGLALTRYAYKSFRWVRKQWQWWCEERDQQKFVNDLVLYHLRPDSGASLYDFVYRLERRVMRVETAHGFDYIEPMPERRTNPERRNQDVDQLPE
jgi:hypothetical protein